MEIYGHRGAAGLVLENTVASISKATELGVDGIEFDVRSSQDGKAVVIHDETLLRTHEISARVADMTADQMRIAMANHPFPVPTLSEVLQAIGDRFVSNVELKERAAVVPALSTLDRLVEDQILDPGRILVTSFDHDAIGLFREHTSRYKIGLLTAKIPEGRFWKLAKSLEVCSVNISKDSVNEAFVNRAHADGRKVMVYTVNDNATLVKLQQMGVDAIFSDFPAMVTQ